MGTLIGHVGPGFGFLLIGLWHLYNHIKLFSLHPKTYRFFPWFPAPKLRHLELLLIAAGSSASISMELFIGPKRHQPLDPDLSIPSNHLHNFEHASISLTFLLYSAFAFAFDRARPARPAAQPLTILSASAAFAQQLFLFHLHSSDHMGVEGQYHWLLQLVIAVSLFTTLMGIGNPRSFAVGFVRSVSIGFQGIWFIVMGYALWTPGLIAKGCFMNAEEGHMVVRCRSEEALHRAKSLVNIEFSCCLVSVVKMTEAGPSVSRRRHRVRTGKDEVNYGPLPAEVHPSIASLHGSHRAAHPDMGTILEAASHMLMVSKWPINCPRFMEGLRELGLECINRLQYIRLDHHLLTALVERWSPQTNTFHFPVGEIMITLQDVGMILGLYLDGPPLIGRNTVGEGKRWHS